MEGRVGCQRLWWPSRYRSSWPCCDFAGRIRKAIVQVAAVGAILVGFYKKLQIFRTKSGPSALHGAEAAFLSTSAMTSLRTASG